MIQKLTLLLICCVPFFGISGERESLPPFWVIKDSVSKSIHPDSVKLVIRVFDYNNQLLLDQHPEIIQARIDKKTKKHTITAKNRAFGYMLSKGKHQFQFFLNASFRSIQFERELEGGKYLEIGIQFEPTGNYNQIMVEKPVIYLYSEHEVPFSLKVNTEAAIQFTYPAYDGGWKGSSSPDGTIRMNGTTYPYLFWDAALNSEKLHLNWYNADVIEGSQVVTYLESQLDRIGFNAKEKADFITYWGPRMQQQPYAEILWLQDENIHPIASLEMSPAFKINRIYLVFRGSDLPVEQTLQLHVPQLKPLDRSGNYLVEWGGMQIQTSL